MFGHRICTETLTARVAHSALSRDTERESIEVTVVDVCNPHKGYPY